MRYGQWTGKMFVDRTGPAFESSGASGTNVQCVVSGQARVCQSGPGQIESEHHDDQERDGLALAFS